MASVGSFAGLTAAFPENWALYLRRPPAAIWFHCRILGDWIFEVPAMWRQVHIDEDRVIWWDFHGGQGAWHIGPITRPVCGDATCCRMGKHPKHMSRLFSKKPKPGYSQVYLSWPDACLTANNLYFVKNALNLRYISLKVNWMRCACNFARMYRKFAATIWIWFKYREIPGKVHCGWTTGK